MPVFEKAEHDSWTKEGFLADVLGPLSQGPVHVGRCHGAAEH